jgi:hypothetical protein
MRGRSVPRQFGQVLTRFWVEEAGADPCSEQNRSQTDPQEVFSGSRRVGVYKLPGLITFRRGIEQFYAIHRGGLLEMELKQDVRLPWAQNPIRH